MSHKIEAQSLPILPRQTIKDIPRFSKFLVAELDRRHNNCLLWTLQNDDKDDESGEDAEIIMLRLHETLTPPNAKYISSFTTNSGLVHVFVVRESEKLFVK